jgi:hypothetical protein
VLAWLVDALDRADGLVGPTGVAFRAAPGRDEAPRCVVGLVGDGEIAWNADAPGTGLVSVRSVDPRAAAPFDPLPWDRAVWRRTHAADDDGRRLRLIRGDERVEIRSRIVVAAESSGARVGVLGEDGNPPSTDADRRVATQIVTLLRDQLR